MKLENSFDVPTSLDETWKLFQDISTIVPCMPGTVLESNEGDTFAGRIKIKVGSVQLGYSGKGTAEYDDSHQRITLALAADETRGSGAVAATIVAQLTENRGHTEIELITDLNLTGRPAQFGRGIMGEVADRLIKQFADNLAHLLKTAHQESGDILQNANRSAGSSAASSSQRLSAVAADPEPLDIGGAVLPVLAKRAVKPAVALSVVALVAWIVTRLSSSGRTHD
ncbi:SRPBCC family protein [Nocardia sp. NPDC004750]